MTKQKNKNFTNNNNKFVKIIAGVVILAFAIFMLSDLFIPKEKPLTKPAIQTQKDNSLKFRKDGELTFQNSKGEFIASVDLEFAETERERAKGLMYRTEMKENQGMLFIFPQEEMQSFWMHNTVLPLDMIFVSKDLIIVTIHKNTKPYDDSSYPSTKPAQYVIEVNAGFTDRHKIKLGDKVVFRRTR